jgi:hypothetical protein
MLSKRAKYIKFLHEAKKPSAKSKTPKSSHRHSVHAKVAAQSTQQGFVPYSFRTQTGEIVDVREEPKEVVADFEPVTGLATPGNEEAHTQRLGRIRDILGSYSVVGVPGGDIGSKTEKSKNYVTYGQLDGQQLFTPPTLAKPAAISTRTGGKGHNEDWDAHIKAGMQEAWRLFTTDKKAFDRLHREARDLAPGLKVWSESPKTKATSEDDPTTHNYAIYAPPADTGRIQNRTACVHCSVGCKGACLSQSGHASIAEAVPLARLKRGHLMHAAPAHFAALMLREMEGHHRAATSEGAVVAWRPNGTTDERFHEWIPHLFDRKHTVKNNKGVNVMSQQHAPMFAGSYSYAYTAVPEILKNFSNATHSFKETGHSIHTGIDHVAGSEDATSWLPMATTKEQELPHAVVFHRGDELVVAPTINGNERDDRPNDPWKSLATETVRTIRNSAKALTQAGFKLAKGTVAVGTTKVPKNKPGADRVLGHGIKTGFIRDPNSVLPDAIRSRLPKALQNLKIHYFPVKPKSQPTVQITTSAPKQTNESVCTECYYDMLRSLYNYK